MSIQLFKSAFFYSLIFLLLQPAYAVNNHKDDLVQLILYGYTNDEEAFDAALKLKKQHIISNINVRGRQLDNKWEYIIVIAKAISRNSAEQIKDKLHQLSYNNTIINTLKVQTPVLSTPKDESISLNDGVSDPKIDDESNEIFLLDDTEVINNTLAASNDPLAADEIQQNFLEWGGSLQLEQQVFTRSESQVDQLQYLHLDAYANWHINALWDVRLGARIDGNYQHGDHNDNDTESDYTDSYLRYRDQDYRFTLGAQTIHWGRMDHFSPNDRLATLDLSRGVLEQWGENYRSVGAVRSELFLHDSKLDFVIIPRFREAELSEKNQVWYPVDTTRGRILGFGDNELLSLVVKNSRIDDNDFSKRDAYGLRYSSMINSVDYAVNIQNIQLSTPYYSSDLQPGQILDNAHQFTLYEEHPENWILGADMAFEWQDMTWRFEAAWFSDLPATTPLWEYKKFNGLEWAGGVEFFPGDSDTRVNMQLSGRHIFNNNEKIVDRDNSITLSGSVESELDNGKWKISTRYSLGLDMKDIYLSPEVSYLGWEAYELYMGYHYLDGADQSVGGFYTNNKLLSLGVRVKH